MGAVAALYYMGGLKEREKRSVLGVVLDSPFSDLEELVKEYCKTKSNLPGFLFKVGLSVINMGVKGKANVDLKKVVMFSSYSYLS